MGRDLLAVIAMTKHHGFMSGDLKSTFIFLIPKKDMLEHFYDFRPIDSCNLVYKMVTKIIANRIKPKLFEVVSKQ